MTLLRILARCPHLDELRLIQLLQSKGHTNTIDLPGPINEELVSFVKDSFLELQDTLTTLEIVRPISSRDTCSESLHRYLCDSPHLLHLKAPDLPFSPLWFDIEGILDAKGSYRREKYGSVQTNSTQYEVVRRYVDPFHRRIWACRNLRTLYLKCSIETGDSYSQESALLIFGYLSKVCPRLQDLSLKRYLLNLSLEGGFCLLMRLTELRRLSIRINPEYLHKVLNVDWMSKAMTKKQRVKMAFVMAARSAISTTIIYATTPFKSTTSLPLPHSKHQAMNQSNTAAEHDNCDDDNTDNGSRSGISMHKGDSDASLSPDYMIDGVDMRNLGRWKDISDVLQDRLFNNWPCWPMLEHLEVELKKRDGDQTKEKIKHLLTTVRPEVEIAFNENWLFRAI
ncbi:hypothetical protein BGZ58_004288 [Dissophora ornata]|nr:hypothetical protein BGZ58_004288 [Dissophora ornata]